MLTHVCTPASTPGLAPSWTQQIETNSPQRLLRRSDALLRCGHRNPRTRRKPEQSPTQPEDQIPVPSSYPLPRLSRKTVHPRSRNDSRQLRSPSPESTTQGTRRRALSEKRQRDLRRGRQCQRECQSGSWRWKFRQREPWNPVIVRGVILLDEVTTAAPCSGVIFWSALPLQ